MAALGVVLIFGGLYLAYVAYEGLHTGTAATPVTKAKAAIS